MSISIRKPIVAGQFYEGSESACRAHIEQMIQELPLPNELPDDIVAAMVPHAGWVFSGAIALLALRAVQVIRGKVGTFVIFGTMHRYGSHKSLMYDSGTWETPLGNVTVDEKLSYEIIQCCANTAANSSSCPVEVNKPAHDTEHSIEVQVPLIKYLFPQAKIVPIMVPPTLNALDTGRIVAEAVKADNRNNNAANDANDAVVILASTDLTHYGPSYGFTPQGTGPAALQWALEQNDRFFLDAALVMQPEQVINIANNYGSACGAGAVAAAVTAASQLGAVSGKLLAHTSSAQIIEQKYHQPSDDSVGYAAVVWG